MDNLEWRRSVDQKIRELYQRVKPSRRRGAGGGSGSSAPSWAPIEAASEEELIEYTDLPANSLGVITDGPLEGSWWGQKGGSWRCLTVWRETIPEEEPEE